MCLTRIFLLHSTFAVSPDLPLTQQMESIDIAGYDVKKCDEYYYLAHRKQTLQSILHTPDLDNFPPGKTSIFGSLSAPFVRSKTPDSEPPQGRWRGHQRSTSATVFPLSHTSQGNMRWRRRGSTPSRDPLSGYPSSTSLGGDSLHCSDVLYIIFHVCLHRSLSLYPVPEDSGYHC